MCHPNKENFKATVPKFGNVAPTKQITYPSKCQELLASTPKLKDYEMDWMIDSRIEILKKLMSIDINVIKSADDIPPDKSVFFIGDNFYQAGTFDGLNFQLVLDSGTSKSTVCNVTFLHILKPIEKTI